MAFLTEHEGFPNIPLTAGMVIKLEAVDPTSETPVAGVTSSKWMIYGEDESEGPPELPLPVDWLEIPTSG